MQKDQGVVSDRKTIGQVFLAALFVRLAFYVAGVALCRGFVETYASMESFGFSDFLNTWQRSDATHYLKLAQLGYQDYIEDGQHLFLVFFPLYPWVIRIAHLLIRNWQLAALAVSTLAFCIGSVFFYSVAAEEYGETVAWHSFWLTALYPFAFFYGGMMTESLFFCLLSAGFYLIRRHNWLAAGIVGFFCAMCRVQGVMLLGVAVIEFFIAYHPAELLKKKKPLQFFKLCFKKGSALLLMPLGVFVYLFINWRVEGDWFRFRVYQKEHWYHTTTLVTGCLKEILHYMRTASAAMKQYVWFPEFFIFLGAVILLLYALKRRHPLRYTAFLAVYTLFNYSVTFLISGARYMACALPAFLFLAEWTKGKKIVYYAVLAVFTGLSVYFLYGFMSGGPIY